MIRWMRHHHIRLTRLKDTPDRIAKGASWGVFVGIVPSFGFGMIVAPLVAGLLKWNKTAAFIGNFVMNPITGPLFWGLSAVVGCLLFGIDLAAMNTLKEDGISFAGLLGELKTTVLILLAGNLVVSFLFSLLTYPVVKRWVERHRRNKAERWVQKRPESGMGYEKL